MNESDIVIIIGSPDLKKKYTSNEKNGSYCTKSVLLQILGSKKIKVPIWFEGNFDDNLPPIYGSIRGLSLVDDYFNKIFDLLVTLYRLSPLDNKVNTVWERFNRILANNLWYDEYKIMKLKERKMIKLKEYKNDKENTKIC